MKILIGKDPFERMKEANVHFLNAGENLALAQTLSIAHNNLMNSPVIVLIFFNPLLPHRHWYIGWRFLMDDDQPGIQGLKIIYTIKIKLMKKINLFLNLSEKVLWYHLSAKSL